MKLIYYSIHIHININKQKLLLILISMASREWFMSVFPQHKLDLSLHVLIIDRLAPFVVDAPSRLEWLSGNML